jgi:hypothetical protein
LAAFRDASDNPFTTPVPFFRVRVRRVLKRDLVIEEIVLTKPQAAGVVNSIGSFDAPKERS